MPHKDRGSARGRIEISQGRGCSGSAAQLAKTLEILFVFGASSRTDGPMCASTSF